jgi:hypothetical protein
MCTQGRYKRSANLYNCTTTRRDLESDIILFNRTFYIHNIKCRQNTHAITKQTIPMQQFTQASRPTNEQANCRSPYQAVTNQRLIAVIKGKISSAECCLWCERTSLGTSGTSELLAAACQRKLCTYRPLGHIWKVGFCGHPWHG